MSRPTKIWLITGVVLLVYMVLTWWLGGIGDTATERLVLRLGLWFIGIAGAAVVLWFALRNEAQKRKAGLADHGEDDIDRAFATAKAHLARARVGGKSGFNKLPMVLVLGPENSTKTTTVVNSGLDPDLLAGEIYRGEAIAPTEGVNIWFSHKTVFVEVGGKVASEPNRWSRLIRHMQPDRLAAVLSGAAQAPRVAVVCFSCEELLRQGASESVPAAARNLRAFLGRVSQGLGIRLPVYLVFTKSDRIPHFADYMRNLSRDEVREVLGTTLRVPVGVSLAAYADREFRRVNDAFQRIFVSLSTKRLKVMPREAAHDVIGNAYEFPREFRKLTDLASQFMVELCKPTQLQVSPFLRGFYFAGVRAVIMSDAVAPAAQAQAAGGGMAATSVFNAPQPMVAAPPPGPATSRKVPQWMFLDRLFREVVLGDRVAQAITQGGVRLNLLRRAAVSSGIAFAAILLLGFMVSFATNRGLRRGVVEAARGLEGITAQADLPDVQTLRRLEALRERLAALVDYEQDGPPLRLRWGLYTGHRMYPDVRRIYADAFERLMFRATRDSMVNALRRLPSAPTDADEFGGTYDLLKAYLMTTTHQDRATAAFLSPILMARWQGNSQLDEERTQLARNQFDFYSEGLCTLNPCALEANGQVVAQARSFLGQFSGTNQIYQFMISQASNQFPPVQFNRAIPGSDAVIVDTYEVPGAFTRPGWDFVQDRLRRLDAFFGEDDYVMGGQTAAPEDLAQLEAELRRAYIQQYVQEWTTYLTSAQVRRFSGIRDARSKVGALSANPSPLLDLFYLAAYHTAVDSQTVGRVFQPVHLVTHPPDSTGQKVLVNETNTPYINALNSLASGLEAAAGDPAAAQQAADAGRAARTAVLQIANGFTVDAEANEVRTAVRQLMEQPIVRATALAASAPAVELNRLGAAYCRRMQPVLNKYPFNKNSAVNATLDEVAEVFLPGTSILSSFADDLSGVLELQGNNYVPTMGATPTPTREFVNFFNRAMSVSRGLYENGNDLGFRFLFQAFYTPEIPSLSLIVDGQRGEFTAANQSAKPFSWQAVQARQAEIMGTVGNRTISLRNGTDRAGPWALFRVFEQVDRWQTSGQTHNLEWDVTTQGQNVTVRAELTLGIPVLHKEYVDGVRNCVGRVAR